MTSDVQVSGAALLNEPVCLLPVLVSFEIGLFSFYTSTIPNAPE